jgi:hypothetical protein
MFCTFFSQYICLMSNLVLRREEDIYVYIYADFVIEAQGEYMCLYMYMQRSHKNQFRGFIPNDPRARGTCVQPSAGHNSRVAEPSMS